MPIVLWYTVEDGKGDRVRLEIPLADGISLDNAYDMIPAFAFDVGSMMTGGIVEAGMTVTNPNIDDLVSHPQADSDLQEKAVFVFRSTFGQRRMAVPTFNEAFFQPYGKAVDLTEPVVAGFVTAMLSGESAGGETGRPSDVRGDALASLSSAFEDWGKARRG